MTIYSFSQAKQNFASVLEQAREQGEVIVKKKDGSSFVIKPVKQSDSPLNVEGVDLLLSADEIVGVLREVRERNNSTNSSDSGSI